MYKEFAEAHWFLPETIMIKESCNLIGQNHFGDSVWNKRVFYELFLISPHKNDNQMTFLGSFEKSWCGLARLVTANYKY